jgi:hypothetical protein
MKFRALAACDIGSPPAIFLEARLPLPCGKGSTESDRDIPNTGETIGVKFRDVKV